MIAWSACRSAGCKAASCRTRLSRLPADPTDGESGAPLSTGPLLGPASGKCAVSPGVFDFVRILVGELRHSGKEWQSEAGGGKTSCLSAFLEVVGLGRFSICHPLPPPATNPYVAFYVAFYVTPQKRTLTATRGKKDSNFHGQLEPRVGSRAG